VLYVIHVWHPAIAAVGCIGFTRPRAAFAGLLRKRSRAGAVAGGTTGYGTTGRGSLRTASAARDHMLYVIHVWHPAIAAVRSTGLTRFRSAVAGGYSESVREQAAWQEKTTDNRELT
jgi:hypothetical protein